MVQIQISKQHNGFNYSSHRQMGIFFHFFFYLFQFRYSKQMNWKKGCFEFCTNRICRKCEILLLFIHICTYNFTNTHILYPFTPFFTSILPRVYINKSLQYFFAVLRKIFNSIDSTLLYYFVAKHCESRVLFVNVIFIFNRRIWGWLRIKGFPYFHVIVTKLLTIVCNSKWLLHIWIERRFKEYNFLQSLAIIDCFLCLIVMGWVWVWVLCQSIAQQLHHDNNHHLCFKFKSPLIL